MDQVETSQTPPKQEAERAQQQDKSAAEDKREKPPEITDYASILTEPECANDG